MNPDQEQNIGSNEPTPVEDLLSSASDKQKKIRDALINLDPEFGKRLSQVYEGLILGFNYKVNPERIPQVCHSARELSSILPRYFPGLPILERVDNRKNPDEPRQRELLKGILGNHPERSALPEYLQETFVDEWMNVHDYFNKYSKHDDIKNKNGLEISEQEFEANVWKFEDLLYRTLVEIPFFDSLDEIESLLKIENPTDSNVATLSQLIAQPQHNRYFFEKCNNPEWLAPLNKRGAFSKPQEPLKQDGYVRFIGWPESQYLVRIVDRKSNEVYEIIKTLDSENQSVLDDFIDAALKSPVEIAAKYVELIIKKKWLQNPYNLLLPDKVAELMEKLAAAGKVDEAIKLARVLFDVHIVKPVSETNEEIPLSWIRPEAKPYFDEWRYKEVITKKTKEIAKASPVLLFQTLATILHQALDLEKRENVSDDFYEYSHIWRPNLGHTRNPNREDAKNVLIDGLIELIENNKNDTTVMEGFVEILSKHNQGFFRRLEMFLHLNATEPQTEAIEKLLTEKKIITSYNLRREYLPLLEKFFSTITSQGQNTILEAIDSGPNLTKTDDTTTEQFDAMNNRWRSMYYGSIKQVLLSPHKEKYEELQILTGPVVIDDGELKVTGGWIGDESPLSMEDMKSMKPDKVIDYLRDFKDSGDFSERMSSSGLGIIFGNVVAENPETYISVAGDLLSNKLKPLYIYHFLNGIKQTLKEPRVLDWKPVIDLCYSIIFVKSGESLTKPGNDSEQNWDSVHMAIADLLGAALGDKNTSVSVDLQSPIWDIILELTKNEEPTIEDEERDNGGNLDPMTLSINTVRGEALHAVVNYALWLDRFSVDIKKLGSKIPKIVEDVLDFHLDTNNDPSLAIRSVYGWRLPNLSYLSMEWVKSRKDKIFPKEKGSEKLFLSAFESYLTNNVYHDLFDLFIEEYRIGISLLGTVEKEGYHGADINEKLPQHLMITYVHDAKHDDLIRHFFDVAPVKSRIQAINFVGRVIFGELSKLDNPKYAIERSLKLWDDRLSATNANIAEELQEFGWWFKRSPFSRQDNITRLVKTLELTNGLIDAPYEVAEELQEYSATFPLEVITALSLIAHGIKEGHEISYKMNEYREIITKVKESGNTEAVNKANELINYLGSRGFIDFRDLL
ncbi:MAG: hypothetical protein IT410_04055 [Candidatus Doudnabacteria bacterium]|nr:hypothetical protein [Candidatus Doudnabacteria bacterium]